MWTSVLFWRTTAVVSTEEDESFGAHGFGKQEFKGEELVDVEPEDDDFGGDDSIDLDDDIDFEE